MLFTKENKFDNRKNKGKDLKRVEKGDKKN